MVITGLAALAAGCAGGETGDNSGTGASSSSSSSSSGAGGAGGAGGQGGGQQTGSGGNGSGGAGTGGAPPAGDLAPNLKSMDMYINCQPIVGPDPVHGSFIVDYDSTGAMGPTSATITNARLVFGGQSSFTFGVTPSGSGTIAPGAVVALTHQKTDGSGSGDKPACSFCNGTWSLEVTFDLNGKSFTDTLPAAPVSCVF